MTEQQLLLSVPWQRAKRRLMSKTLKPKKGEKKISFSLTTKAKL